MHSLRIALSALGGLGLIGAATADSTTFDLNGITWVNDTLNGFSYGGTHVTNGELVWTYTAGDFVNGTGTLSFLNSPYSFMPGGAISTVDTTQITVTDQGNTQNLTYDVAINFLPNLTATGATIASGTYDITGSDGYVGGEFIGHITGGTVTPAPEPVSAISLAGGLLALSRRRRIGN